MPKQDQQFDLHSAMKKLTNSHLSHSLLLCSYKKFCIQTLFTCAVVLSDCDVCAVISGVPLEENKFNPQQ